MTQRSLDASSISDCLINLLSPGSECVVIDFSLQRCNHSVFLLCMVTHCTSDVLHCWSLHPDWYSYNLLVMLLPECMSIVSHLINLAVE